MVVTVCEGDDYTFPWHVGDLKQATFANLTFVNSNDQASNLLQKLSINGLMEARNQRLDYRSTSIILKEVNNDDRGLYVFDTKPNNGRYKDVSVVVIGRDQGTLAIIILV